MNHMTENDVSGTTPAAAAGPRITVVVAQLFDILEPLDAGFRARALRGVLAMLADGSGGVPLDLGVPVTPSAGAVTPTGGTAPPPSDGASKFAKGKKAQAWLRRNSLTDDVLDHVFHVENDDGRPVLFAPVPGTGKKGQTINCYLLVAAQNFLATDELKVTEAEVVAVAKDGGYYDRANHSVTRGALGNRFSGNKDVGFILTTPGQDAAAALIKSIAADAVK